MAATFKEVWNAILNSRVAEPINLLWSLWNGATAAETTAGVTIVSYRYDPGNVLRYGTNTTPGTTNMTTAINAAIAVGILSGVTVFIPAGNYLVTSALTTIPGSLTVRGEGSLQTTITHNPTANGVCFTVANGAERAAHGSIRGLRVRTTDTTYTKVAFDLYDMSMNHFDDLYVHGVGGTGAVSGAAYTGGTGSFAFRIHGREACSFRGIAAFADYPVYFAANPNTDPDDGEDIDHFHFRDCYLGATAGHYIVTVADGLGVINLTFDGHQAWIAGDGGFYMNDTRAAPVVPSRHISFSHVRGEQGLNVDGYWFDFNATVPIQQIELTDVLGATGTQGIHVDAVQRLVLKNVTMATASGKNCLLVEGATAASVIDMIGCNWQASSVFTLTGYTPNRIDHFDSAGHAGPSTASYASIRTDTSVNVAKVTATCANAAVGLLVTGTTGDALQGMPQAAGSGVALRSVNNAQTDFEPMSLVFETMDERYRTGAGTSASSRTVDATGKNLFIAPTTAGASINLPHGSAPTSPVNGDVWSTTAGLFVRVNGATVGPFSSGSSGTYTPTLTNVANLDGSTAFECQYMQIGTVVTVSGKVSVNPTTPATLTQLGISLPVASNLGAEEDCAGAAFASGIAGQGAAIRGDAANNRAEMAWIAGDVSDQPMYFSFSYQVI